jgi:hypothetical protein
MSSKGPIEYKAATAKTTSKLCQILSVQHQNKSMAFAVHHKSTLQKDASIKASVTQWDTKSNVETLVNS